MAEMRQSRSNGRESLHNNQPSLKLQQSEGNTQEVGIRKSVSEKIIFCIDENLLSKLFKSQRRDYAMCLLSALSNFVAAKKKISTKPTEFFIMPLNGAPYLDHLTDNITGQEMIRELRENMAGNDEIPYDLSKMFTALAQQLELPDPSFYSGGISPPHVYHVILLFGSSNPPEISNFNPFYFLLDNPYFIFDIVHIKSFNIPKEQYNYVQDFLKSLLNSNGFYFPVDISNNSELSFHLTKLLSHCIYRSLLKPL